MREFLETIIVAISIILIGFIGLVLIGLIALSPFLVIAWTVLQIVQ